MTCQNELQIPFEDRISDVISLIQLIPKLFSNSSIKNIVPSEQRYNSLNCISVLNIPDEILF